MKNKLIPTILREADILENNEGVDPQVLREAIEVTNEEFVVLMSGEDILSKYFK